MENREDLTIQEIDNDLNNDTDWKSYLEKTQENSENSFNNLFADTLELFRDELPEGTGINTDAVSYLEDGVENSDTLIDFFSNMEDTTYDDMEYLSDEQLEKIYAYDLEIEPFNYDSFMEEQTFYDDVPDIPIPVFEEDIEKDNSEVEPLADAKLDSSIIESIPGEYLKAVENGLIPPVLRDKGDEKYNIDITIKHDTVESIREQLPDFGTMLGGTVDTTGRNQLYGVNIEDIRPFVPDEYDKDLEKINVYVDYGKADRISSEDYPNLKIDFHSANIVTFEFIPEHGQRYYSSYISNDVGKIYASIPVFERNIPLSIEGQKLDFLDRTNIDSPQHYKRIEAAVKDENGNVVRDEKGRIVRTEENGNPVAISPQELLSLREAIDAFIPEGLDAVSDLITQKIEENKSSLEGKILNQESIVDSVANIYDNVETERQYLGGNIEQKSEELDNITEDIVNIIDDLNSTKDKVEISELSVQLDDLKEKYKDTFSDFRKEGVSVTDDKADFKQVSASASSLFEILGNAEHILEVYKEQFDILYTDKDGYDIEKGTFNDSKMSAEDRFLYLSGAEVTMGDVDVSLDSISIKEMDSYIGLKEMLVDDWNKDPDHKDMQLSLDKNTGEIWSQYGFKVECDKGEGKTVIDSFYSDKATVNLVETPLKELERKDDFDKESIKTYAEQKIPETDIKIGDIGKEFYDQTVRNGKDIDKIDMLSKGKFDTKGLEISNKIIGQSDISEENRAYFDSISKEITGISRNENYDKIENKEEDVSNNNIDLAKTEKGFNKDDIEKIAKSASNRVFGKVDVDKKVELSNSKKDKLEKDALSKLEVLKENIVKYEQKLEKYDTWPPQLVSRNKGYQMLKLRHDNAIYKYEQLGGKVGEGCFVTKGVSIAEKYANFSSWYFANPYASLLDSLFVGLSKDEDNMEKTENVDKEDKGSEDHNIIDFLKDIFDRDSDSLEVIVGEPVDVYGEVQDIENNELDDMTASQKEMDNVTEPEDAEERDVEHSEDEADNITELEDSDEEELERSENEADNAIEQENPEEDVEWSEGEVDNVTSLDDSDEKMVEQSEEDTENVADVADPEDDKEENVEQSEEEEDDTARQEESKKEDVEQLEEKADDATGQEDSDKEDIEQSEEEEDKATGQEDSEEDIEQSEEESDNVIRQENPDGENIEQAGETETVIIQEDTTKLEDIGDENVEHANEELYDTGGENTDVSLEDKLTKEDAIVGTFITEGVDEVREIDIPNNEDTSKDAENIENTIKEKINDFLEEKDNLQDSLENALENDIDPQDLMDVAVDCLMDNVPKGGITDEYADIAGEIVNEIANDIGGIIDDNREYMMDKLSDNLDEVDIETIREAEADYGENAEPYDLDEYGSYNDYDFNEQFVFDDGTDFIDSSIENIEHTIEDGDNDYMVQIPDDIDRFNIVDDIVSGLENETDIDSSMAYDLAQDYVDNSMQNEIPFDNDSDNEFVEQAINSILDGINTVEVDVPESDAVDNVDLSQGDISADTDIVYDVGFDNYSPLD